MARLGSIVRSLADGVFGAAGAAGGSQIPEFMQQYIQKLDVVALGLQRAGDHAVDAAAIGANVDALVQAGGAERFVLFIRTLQGDVAMQTWSFFRPALPLTLESIAYALVGIVLALILRQIIAVPFHRRPARRASDFA